MKKKIILSGLPVLLIINMVWAQGLTDTTTPETSARLESELQSMSEEDRTLYLELSGSGEDSDGKNPKGDNDTGATD